MVGRKWNGGACGGNGLAPVAREEGGYNCGTIVLAIVTALYLVLYEVSGVKTACYRPVKFM